MPDNVPITAGSGTTIATDELAGGVQIQRTKPAFGGDGVATDVSSVNPLPVRLPELNQDSYNQLVTVTRAVQINLVFTDEVPANLIRVFTTDSATSTRGSGEATFSSGVDTTSTLLARSLPLTYTPGYELYASFSARFTTPSSANSSQRIGPYGTVDGFFFGYNGTGFGLGSRFNGTDTLVAQASWNVDTCTGGAGSSFRSNGSPVTLDPTRTNIYRIRFGWHGASVIHYEILSPDGDYVTVHKLRTANVLTTPSMTDPNVPITLQITKSSADATNLIVSCGAWSGGTTAPPLVNRIPGNTDTGLAVRPVGQEVWTVSFSESGSSVLSPELTAPRIGSNFSFNQSSGSLNIITGVSTNAGWLTRSVLPFQGSLRLRFAISASQRIANTNLFVMLADLVGENLAYTVISTTTVDVTLPNHGFTDQNIGQFMMLGGIVTSVGQSFIPGRCAIVSITDVNTIRFTVPAGVAPTATGTLTLFGHSYSSCLFTGTDPTLTSMDTQRRGWAAGPTVATTLTTITPGTIITNEISGREVFWMDSLRSSSTLPNVVTRASRFENIPDDNTPLHLFIFAHNGTSSPVSSTTWTFSFVAIEKYANHPVYIQGSRPQSTMNALPVTYADDMSATRPPPNTTRGLAVRQVGQEVWNASFSDVGASVLSSEFVAPIVGTGHTFAQAAGNLTITTGTTVNSGWLTRSVLSFQGSLRFKFSIVAPRIANTNLFVMLADLVGENLAYTVISTTTVDVTLPNHGFTTRNVGQSMMLGGIVTSAGLSFVPGRCAIASITDVNTIRFTVPAGVAPTATGTLTLFGYSYVRNLFNGTTSTSVAVDAQRRGWASNDNTATINTTVSPGTIITNELTGREVFWMDQLRVSTTLPTAATRASRYENTPDDTLPLFVFIYSLNGSTAPVSTTWTIGFMAVEKYANNPVYIQGSRSTGATNPIAVAVQGTVTANQGTMVALPAGAAIIGDVAMVYRTTSAGTALIHNVVCLAALTVQTVKATAGRVVGIYAVNTNASIRWLKVFNTVAGSVTLGTTAAVMQVPLPPNVPVYISLEGGLGFATAITYVIQAASGLILASSAPSDNDVTGFIAFG